jgi:hypothetical protein
MKLQCGGTCSAHPSTLYEGRLKSSWIHFITPSRNFVEVRWRSFSRSTSIDKWGTSYNAPPTFRKHAAYHLLQASGGASELPFHGWKGPESAWGEIWTVWQKRIGKWIGETPLEHPPYSPDLAPCNFWAFPTMRRKLWGSSRSLWQTVCSTFSRCGWNVVRSASLSKGGCSKKKPSPHLHKVPTRSNKASPRNLQTSLILTEGHVHMSNAALSLWHACVSNLF